MIACFLSNISAKYYKNPSMLSRVIAKNVGDVFLRHSVDDDNDDNCFSGVCVVPVRVKTEKSTYQALM